MEDLIGLYESDTSTKVLEVEKDQDQLNRSNETDLMRACKKGMT
jgi:hypothetical protein